jgi:hypothetical protein
VNIGLAIWLLLLIGMIPLRVKAVLATERAQRPRPRC